MFNHLIATSIIFAIGFAWGFMCKTKDELQSDENIKEAKRIINNKTKINDY